MNKETFDKLVSRPTKGPVVYFLVCKCDVVYIGTTIDADQRLYFHRWKNGNSFDSAFFLPVEEADASRIEFEWIAFFQPKYNVRGGKQDGEETSWSSSSKPNATRMLSLSLSHDLIIAAKELAKSRGINVTNLFEIMICEMCGIPLPDRRRRAVKSPPRLVR